MVLGALVLLIYFAALVFERSRKEQQTVHDRRASAALKLLPR
jgi:hypothetical protein